MLLHLLLRVILELGEDAALIVEQGGRIVRRELQLLPVLLADDGRFVRGEPAHTHTHTQEVSKLK